MAALLARSAYSALVQRLLNKYVLLFSCACAGNTGPGKMSDILFDNITVSSEHPLCSTCLLCLIALLDGFL